MKLMDTSQKAAIGTIAAGVAARLLPHPWNFTPLMVIGLYAGARSARARTGVLAVLLALFLSDAVLGFYRGMWYVYAASLIPVFIGRFVRRGDGWQRIAAGALCSSLAFFVITNFAVWATGGLYPHTPAGLAACFAAAVPFYANQFAGDAFYTAAFFGGEVLLGRVLRPAQRAA